MAPPRARLCLEERRGVAHVHASLGSGRVLPIPEALLAELAAAKSRQLAEKLVLGEVQIATVLGDSRRRRVVSDPTKSVAQYAGR